MTYTFATPVTVGSYPNQQTVASVRVASIAFNFEKVKRDAGTATCSIVIEDATTGFKFSNPMLTGPAVLAAATALLAALHTPTSGPVQSIESVLLQLALTATDSVSGKSLLPAGGAIS